jgi:hypothetical protein
MSGQYWRRRRVVLEPIREIVAGGDWREAEARFQAIRRSAQPEPAPRGAHHGAIAATDPRPAAPG